MAQTSKRIEILNADNTFANANQHPEYWRLVGNVTFKHNNAIMHCDSAYHFKNKDKIKAFGRIKIKQGDSISLTGNNLTYFGSKNQVDIRGSVILIDKYMTLKTEQIFYNLNTNIASYPFIGQIIDNEKTINSKKGKYNSNIHTFIFKDSVTVIAEDYNIRTDNMHYDSNSEITYFFGPSYIISKDKTIYCENGWYNTKMNISQFNNNAYFTSENYILRGDSLFYNKNLGYAKAIKNVKAIDTIENITIFGGLAEYYEKEEIIEITENPLLQILIEKDTLFISADKFINIGKTGSKKILAYNKVTIYKTDFQGKCYSLIYDFNDSIIEMFNKPILWVGEFQITSDSLKFLTNKGKISRMYLKPNPIIIAEDDSINYNQIKGKSITTYFINNKMHKMKVKGNGQSIFIISDEETNEKIGVNFTECSNMTLYFEKSKLVNINYEIKPKSVTTPYIEMDEKNRYLEGFHLRNTEQPKRKDYTFIE